MSKYDELLQQTEQELFDALQALEDRNLPHVRSCTARAQSSIIDAWKLQRAEEESSGKTGDTSPVAA